MRKINFTGGAAEIVETASPTPGPGQVLIRTEAVGVGIGLARLLAGDGPVSPGGEVVGTVAAVGSDVSGYATGDRVGGVVFADAYAELVVADPRLLGPVPAGVEAGAALALVRGGLVALAALRTGRFQPGESVLVTAAASGVGHLAVQLARTLGAGRVVGAVSAPDKSDFVLSCGADETVTYSGGPWGDPVDLALDAAGGEALRRSVDALAPFGRVVAFSATGGPIDTAALLPGMRTVHGLTIGTLHRTRPWQVDAIRAELRSLLAADRLRPRHVDLPFAAAGEAVALIATRSNRGRVVLVP